MTNIIIACLGRRPVASLRYIFSDGMCFVLLMFLNKAFITARLAQEPSAPSDVERLTSGTMTFSFMNVPLVTHLFVFVLPLLWSLTELSGTGGRDGNQATPELHEHCEMFGSSLRIYFFHGRIDPKRPLSCSP